jgi:hypothetical protein
MHEWYFLGGVFISAKISSLLSLLLLLFPVSSYYFLNPENQ